MSKLNTAEPEEDRIRSLRDKLEALQPGRSDEWRSNETTEPLSAALVPPLVQRNLEQSTQTNLECSPNEQIDQSQEFKLPSPPSKSPGSSPSAVSNEQDFRDANPSASRDYRLSRAVSCPVRQGQEQSLDLSNEVCGPRSLPLSNASSQDSYIWSRSASCSEIPNSLAILEGQHIIPPLKEIFDVVDGRFDEGIHWYKIISLGEGAFGQCYLASERKENSERSPFCVKICKYRDDEVLALALARKNNIAEIVEFYGATVTPKENGKEVCIFMEFMEGGSIADIVKCSRDKFPNQRPMIPVQHALNYLKDVLAALTFTHEKGLVHNDVKGANVLLDENTLHAKLADFGSATSHHHSRYSFDIWAAGCFLMEMLEGNRPTELLAMTNTGTPYSGPFRVYVGEKERNVLSMCFSRNHTAKKILRYLQA